MHEWSEWRPYFWLGCARLTVMGSILLVDDEAKILNALANALRGEGHEVVATRRA